jgi:hypothetical protein
MMSDHLAPVPTPIDKAKGPDMAQMANLGLYRSSGLVQREFITALRGNRANETWREMSENDAVVGAVLFQIDMLLRQVEWDVEPTPSSDNGEISDYDIERADFLRSCMDDMAHSWEEVISDALTMLPFGFSLMEIVYKRRESAEVTAKPEGRTRFPDGKIGWRKFVFVPQETIADWELDDYGGIQGVTQRVSGAGITIPIEKLLLFRTNRRNPTGRSVLRTAYRAWYFKKRIEEIEGIGVERDLAGLPVIYADADYLARHTSELQRIVRNIRRDEQEGVLLPDIRTEQGERALTLELLTSGGQRQFSTGEIIARHNREIAMSVMQDVLLLGHEKVGTQALAQEKRDLSAGALKAWLNLLAATFNDHAVPRLFALNGEPLEALPRLCPGDLQPMDVAEFATAIREVAAAGFAGLAADPEVENYVRRRLGVPQLVPEVAQQMTEDMLNPPEPPPVVAPDGQPAPEGDDDE